MEHVEYEYSYKWVKGYIIDGQLFEYGSHLVTSPNDRIISAAVDFTQGLSSIWYLIESRKEVSYK
jgi:hypothetical protein